MPESASPRPATSIALAGVFLVPLALVALAEWRGFHAAGGLGGFFLDLARHAGARPGSISGYGPDAVPMAYPVFGLWFIALFDRLGLVTMQSLLWIGYALYGVALVAIYRLAVAFSKNALAAAIATALYALSPAAIEFATDAGGYVRALGLLFTATALVFAHRVFLREPDRAGVAAIILCGAFTGLAVGTHPQEALFCVVSIVYFAVFRRPWLRALQRLVAVGAVALLVSSPWWAPIVLHGGLSPILQAGGSRHAARLYWFLTLFRATSGSFVSTLGPIAFCLALYDLSRGRLVLPGWLFLAGFTLGEPRTLLVGALLAARFMAEWAPAAPPETALPKPWQKYLLAAHRHAALLIGAALLVVQLFEGLAYVTPALDPHARAHPFTATVASGFVWLREHTPPGARFVVLGDAGEEFPVTAGRTDLLSYRGREWTSRHPTFTDYSEKIVPAITACATVACTLPVLAGHALAADFYVIPRQGFLDANAQARWDSAQAAPAAKIVYRNADIIVLSP
ncbi:MAG: glycosyltransferase family 39 protein [Rhizomicrobium sp.]